MARWDVAAVGTVVGLFWTLQLAYAQTVAPCPDRNTCAQVMVGKATGQPADTVSVGLTFKQGPTNGQPGGIDEIAALALTLRMGSEESGAPLTLADCTLNQDGLPNAVKLAAGVTNFKVVVENVSCAGRPACLCPTAGSGETRANYINLAIFGPNPLPTPGSMPVERPTLPAGPQQLLTIDLHIAANATGTIPLHVLNPWEDSDHPQSTAFISAGDKLSVDQTCVPVPASPPCEGAGRVSQVATTDGSVTVVVATPTSATPTSAPTPTAIATPTSAPTFTQSPTATSTLTLTPAATATETPTVETMATPTIAATETPNATPVLTATLPPTPVPCLGDCNGSREVTVEEILTMVNIALENATLPSCPAGDANGDAEITVDEILGAVNNALNGCR